MRTLNLLIKPTSHLCNLDCTYCFYKRVSAVYPGGAARMTPDTARTLIDRALSTGASLVTFCWQGGEPTLLGLDFFREVISYQRAKRRPGQAVENSIQTNGLRIDREWAAFLRDENILVGLSLDGPKDIHDRYRTHADGRGSFEQVMAAAGILTAAGAPFNILTLLTDANVNQPERLFSFFRDHGFGHLQFIGCHETDPGTGRPRPYSVDAGRLGDFYVRLFDLWLEDGFPLISIRLFEDILLYFLDGVRASCAWLGACDSYLVVEHNGDCYPCDFYVYPEWRLGNILEDDLDRIANRPLRRRFAEMKSDLAARCLGCRYFDFCQGDCTRFRRSGGVSDYCGAWQKLLGHVLDHPAGVIEKARRAREDYQRRVFKDAGRNDPCPCGSGRKFKKCCLPKMG